MQWIITKDLINNKPGEKTRLNYKSAPKSWLKEYADAHDTVRTALVQRFKESMTDEFRLFDDDGELYYEGLCKDLDDQDADSAFAPLDWAMNDVGCTRMDYRKKGETAWQTL